MSNPLGNIKHSGCGTSLSKSSGLTIERGLTISRLNEVISYDQDSGIFKWKIDRYRKSKAGDIAGSISSHGYVVICIDYKTHPAHRLAWAISFGSFPDHFIDHENRIKTDNRLNNLRCVTNKQNCENMPLRIDSNSRILGVTWHKGVEKWQAQIHHNQKAISLGYYKDIFSAACARKSAELRIFTHSAGR